MLSQNKNIAIKDVKPVQQTLHNYFQVIKPEIAKNFSKKSSSVQTIDRNVSTVKPKAVIMNEISNKQSMGTSSKRKKSKPKSKSSKSVICKLYPGNSYDKGVFLENGVPTILLESDDDLPNSSDLTVKEEELGQSPRKRNFSQKSMSHASPTKKIRSDENLSSQQTLDNDSTSEKCCGKKLFPDKEKSGETTSNSINSETDLYPDESNDTIDLSNYGIHRNDLISSYTASPCEEKHTPHIDSKDNVLQVVDSVTGQLKELRRVSSLPFHNENDGAPMIKLESSKKAETTVAEEDSFIVETFSTAWTTILANSSLFRVINESEQAILKKFFNLPTQDQDLCLHLFSYQPKWYQLSKYTSRIRLEVSDVDLEAMTARLESHRFIRLDYKSCESLESQLNILTMDDIKVIAKRFRLKFGKRDVLIARIVNYARMQTSVKQNERMEDAVKDAVQQQLGICVFLDESLRKALFHLALLNFFPLPNISSVHDFFFFVAKIRNQTVALPSFNISLDFDIFPSCSSFESFADATALYFEYLELQSKNKVDTCKLMEIAMKASQKLHTANEECAKKSAIRMRFTANHVYVKLLSQACQHFSKSHSGIVGQWLKCLLQQSQCAHKRGEWYEELLKHTPKARKSDVISNGLADPAVNFCDKSTLSARGLLCIKRKLVNSIPGLISVPEKNDIRVTTILAHPIDEQTRSGKRILYKDYMFNQDFLTVEEIAMRHYALEQYEAVHCEGELVKTLFTILFWDIVYADVPGAFVNRIQYTPLDLYTDEFYTQRKDRIDNRLKQIEDTWMDKEFFHVVDEWLAEHSHQLSLHSPRIVDTPNLIVDAITCITRPKLAKILRRFVTDIRQYQAGMPDLFVWNVSTKKCIFVEVKSAKDVLSMKQKIWMQFLRQVGLETEECRVKNDTSDSSG